jgi:hypothetical protein
MSTSSANVLAERLRRQRLTAPLETPAGYVELFRLLQPVSTVAYTRPGDPPRLIPRTCFDDGAEANRLRARRAIVKGRFLGGGIGYVLADDLALYANAFQRPLTRSNEVQKEVLAAVQSAGPLTPRQIKEETGLLNKQIMPALHRLQKAFLVFEDQVDENWERWWYDFASEWPEVAPDDNQRQAASVEVMLRFLQAHVFATFEQLKDWSQFPSRFLRKLVREMKDADLIVPQVVQGLGEGWMRAQDVSMKMGAGEVAPSVFMLHRADFLVRSHASELKRRFGDHEVLQYLLIDGAFQGAVLGHWRIGPHDVDNVVVELPAAERAGRRDEILDVLARWYHPPRSCILRYAGEKVADVPSLRAERSHR